MLKKGRVSSYTHSQQQLNHYADQLNQKNANYKEKIKRKV